MINEALASKNLDAAIYGDFPAFTSKSNGIDTTVVANLNSKYQCGILVAADKTDVIKEPKELEGKKVIMMTGTSIQYFWEQYVSHYEIDGISSHIHPLSFLIITNHNIFLIRSRHSATIFLGAAALIRWNPAPVFPNIFPLSSHSFASYIILRSSSSGSMPVLRKSSHTR